MDAAQGREAPNEVRGALTRAVAPEQCPFGASSRSAWVLLLAANQGHDGVYDPAACVVG